MPTVTRKALGTVYLVMLMDVLNFGIVFPLVPMIAKEFGASATMVGVMVTSYSLCQFIMTTPLGRISDKCGRRPVLLVSLLGSTLSSVGTGLASTFWMVLLARCINGLSGATVGVVNAYVADVTNAEERPVYMSYVSAANAIGMVLGPAVGGLLSRRGFPFACYVSAGISAVNLLIAVVFLSESRRQARDVAVPLTGAAASSSSNEVPATESSVATGAAESASGEAGPSQPEHSRPSIPPAAALLNIAGFLLILGFAAMESIISYYLTDTFFHGNAHEAGEFYGELFMVVGMVMFIVSFFIYKRLLRCCGLRVVVIVGTLVRVGGFVWMPFASSTMTFAAALFVVVSGTQLITPSVSSLLTSMVPETIYGRALSRQQATQTMARVLGPIILGKTYDKVDHKISLYVLTVATLIAGILISLVPKKYIPTSTATRSGGCAAVADDAEPSGQQPGKAIDSGASSGSAV
mmetsp:Transcript_121614/g.305846  ORF Transcript_121614/g.305846 Transcript_121614/m.305846 type:complete len:465 (-) Transcript_121614:267-1661(-)